MSDCRAHLEEFVRNFFAPADSGAALLWALTAEAKASRWFDPTDPADVEVALAAAERMTGQADLYYGVCLRVRKMARYERGGEDDCTAQLAAVADLDVEGPGHKGEGLFPTIETALEALRQLPLPPTFIIHSAGGIQAGWCFREPADPHDPLIAGIRQRLVETLRRHAGPWEKGVDSTVDAARIMRLPGTFNLKEGLRRATFLLERDWQRRYDPSELDEILDPLQQASPTPKRERGPFADNDDSIGRIVDESTTWGELLSRDGWEPMKWHGDERYWVRPGKDKRDGHSAVEHRDGPLSVFTTAIPSLCQPWALNRNQNSWTYGRFGYIAATRHGGNLSEAGRAARLALNDDVDEIDWSQLTAPEADLDENEPEQPGVTVDEPPLIPLAASPPVDPFPLDALTPWIGDHAAAVAVDLQVPLDLPAVLALGVLSTLCAGRARLNVRGNWNEHLNLFLAIAMPPGSGKSPAYRQMAAPIIRLEQQIQKAAERDIAEAEQRQRLAKKQLEDAELRYQRTGDGFDDAARLLQQYVDLKVPSKPMWFVDDATPESVARALNEQGGRIAFLSTEGGIFDQMGGRYSDRPNLDVYLKGWSGDHVRVTRIGRDPVDVPEAVITVAVTVQPSVITGLAEHPELAGRGLTARFMYSVPQILVGTRNYLTQLDEDDISPFTAVPYEEQLRSLYARIAGSTTLLTLERKALETFTEFRHELETHRGPDGRLGHIAEWTTKLESSVLRLAGLLHLADGQASREPVGAGTLERALQIGRYWLSHMLAVQAMWTLDHDVEAAKDVVAWARRNGVASFTPRDVYRGLRRFKRAEDAVVPLELLVERGWLAGTVVVPGRGGKGGTKKAEPLSWTATARAEMEGMR